MGISIGVGSIITTQAASVLRALVSNTSIDASCYAKKSLCHVQRKIRCTDASSSDHAVKENHIVSNGDRCLAGLRLIGEYS